MPGIVDIRTILFVLSLLTNIRSTKVLSDQKKCGDPECETSMSRVQAIKDYVGPDCRYLNFKTGEEIMVYFKLSRKREDLWAGSKGTDFGYFPMNAVQIEEVFITKEVEVPTKETDFLCLDGGEYTIENEENRLNLLDEGNENRYFYTNEKDSELKMSEHEYKGIKEHEEVSPEKYEYDSKSEELHSLDITTHTDSEFKGSKTGQDETIILEEQSRQMLKPVPTQSTWTISGLADWLGLESAGNKEAASTTSEGTEEMTFRHRKIKITEDSDFEKLNEEVKTELNKEVKIEPKNSGWFRSTLTDLLNYGSEKTGLGVLYKENDPEVYDSSAVSGNIDDHTVSETSLEGDRDSEHRDSEPFESNWFDLELRDVLAFGYSKENKVKEELSVKEKNNHDEEPSVPIPNAQPSLMGEQMGKQTDKTVTSGEENKEQYNEETSKEILGPASSEDEKYEQEENADLNEPATSFPADFADKSVKQDSKPRNQAMENINTKDMTKEPERTSDQSDKELHNGQHLEAKYMPPENTENKIHTSVKNGQHQLDLKETSPEENLPIQNYVNTKEAEREWLIQIIMHLNDFWAFVTSGFSVIISISKKVIAALPEDMKPGPDLYGFPWEIVICCSLISIFIILLLMCRSYKSIRSRLYVGREKQLANQVAELVEDKCKVLEKFSLCKKEYEELENTLKDASVLQGSTITSELKTTYKELSSSNSKLKNEIKHLEKELKEEKSKRSEQDDLMVEIQRRADSLENEAKSVQLQIAEAKNTLKVYEINRERLKTSVEDAIEENRHLHESEKQLLQEAEGWGERFSELNEQTKMFECSKTDMEEALRNKESQVKSLTECLLKMKDWSSVVGDNDAAEDSHWENDIKSETENGEHLDEQEKRTVKKLIYAAKLNACLKSMETERNQVYSKLRDENKAKEELAERIESLQREHVLLQSENKDFENEVQKLQQKLKVMTELYQENEMNLHRKLTVEEKERLQKEEKLSKADEKIVHAAEELNTYRQRAKDLEEELERTIRSYENQIMSHEKKAHDNWLSARAAERHLNDIRKENLHNRQQLTEAEFKYDLLEKDPYALDVPVRIFGREHSPYGPSPMGRPSSETRAFLSPPTLLEGPLRLSPVLPGGGGRGSRGQGNTSTYDVGNERREINSDRFSDPHRPPSDTGSLSPPWDRDPRITSSHAGQLYNEQSLPSRRPERFYHPNSGRLSGPAELRNYNMHSFDKADGQASENNSRMDLSGDGIKEHSNDTNMVNTIEQSLTPEMENLGPAMVPPPLPLLRAPLMPMDPRGPFMRRPGLPFPLVPPTSVYGPREYFPRDFSGLPRPMLPMRGPFPVRPFSQYPPRAGFLPPPPPPPDNRNELPAEVTHPSTATSTDHQEPQQGT